MLVCDKWVIENPGATTGNYGDQGRLESLTGHSLAKVPEGSKQKHPNIETSAHGFSVATN